MTATDFILKPYGYYMTRDGHVAQIYCINNVGSEFGTWGGRIDNVPGRQMWDSIGGGYVGSEQDWYLSADYYRPEAKYDLVSVASAEEIEIYETITPLLSIVRERLHNVLSHDAFSGWIAPRDHQPVKKRNEAVTLLKEYLDNLRSTLPPFSFMCESWYDGYGRHGVIVGLEFADRQYLKLPNHFWHFQNRSVDLHREVGLLWKGIQPNNRLVWQEGSNDSFLRLRQGNF